MTMRVVLGLCLGLVLGFVLRPLVWPDGDDPDVDGALDEPREGTDATREAAGGGEAPTLEGAVAPYPDVRAELAAAKARIAELEAAAAKRAARPAGATRHNPWAAHKLPEGIWPVAERVGAPEDLVRLAWQLRNGAFKDSEEAAAVLARLRAAGKEGLLAFVALSLGPSTGHTAIPGLMAKLEVPDTDVILIDLIGREEHPHGLVSALGHQDTPRARDFLIDFLPKHTQDPSMYWYTATSLGQLKEPRGARYLDIEAIVEPRWAGVRGHILHALGEMGGPDAAAKLGQYLTTPHADKLGSAAAALAKIDPDAARRHAKRLLASDRARFIHFIDRSTLEKLAKED